MRLSILILIMLPILVSCDNNSEEPDITNCAFSDPLEDLLWLKTLKETMVACDLEISIFQAKYEGKPVFYVAITDPAANTIFGVDLLDCEGNRVILYKIGEHDAFYREVTDQKVLYRCN